MHGVRTSAPRASDSGRLHGASVRVPRIRDPGAQNRQVSLPGLREWTAKPEPDCHLGPTMSPLQTKTAAGHHIGGPIPMPKVGPTDSATRPHITAPYVLLESRIVLATLIWQP